MSDILILHFWPSGKRLTIERDTIAGRSEESCDLCLPKYFTKGDYGALSRQHFKIYKGKDGFYIVDLDSKNGTTVDHISAHKPRILRDGSQIKLAKNNNFRIRVIITKDTDATKEISDCPEHGVSFDEGYSLFCVDGKHITAPLPELEEKLLKFLCNNTGQICSYDEIIRLVWEGGDVTPQMIARRITALRKKLDKTSLGSGMRYIKTIQGEGYMLYNHD